MAYIKWDGQWYLLGLVFAGIDPETGQSESYICRIDYVMKALQIGSTGFLTTVQDMTFLI